MVFRLEAQLLSSLTLLAAQRFVTEFLEVAAPPANQEAVTPLFFLQIAPYEPAPGEYTVHQIQGTQQVDDAVDSDLVQVPALPFHHLPDVVG